MVPMVRAIREHGRGLRGDVVEINEEAHGTDEAPSPWLAHLRDSDASAEERACKKSKQTTETNDLPACSGHCLLPSEVGLADDGSLAFETLQPTSSVKSEP